MSPSTDDLLAEIKPALRESPAFREAFCAMIDAIKDCTLEEKLSAFAALAAAMEKRATPAEPEVLMTLPSGEEVYAERDTDGAPYGVHMVWRNFRLFGCPDGLSWYDMLDDSLNDAHGPNRREWERLTMLVKSGIGNYLMNLAAAWEYGLQLPVYEDDFDTAIRIARELLNDAEQPSLAEIEDSIDAVGVILNADEARARNEARRQRREV